MFIFFKNINFGKSKFFKNFFKIYLPKNFLKSHNRKNIFIVWPGKNAKNLNFGTPKMYFFATFFPLVKTIITHFGFKMNLKRSLAG